LFSLHHSLKQQSLFLFTQQELCLRKTISFVASRITCRFPMKTIRAIVPICAIMMILGMVFTTNLDSYSTNSLYLLDTLSQAPQQLVRNLTEEEKSISPPLFQSLTNGWTEVEYGSMIPSMQFPCKSNISDHYTIVNGVSTFTVKSSDRPFDCSNPPKTRPRCEATFRKVRYSTGQHQFQAFFKVPSNTSNASLMQILGGTVNATSFMLGIIDRNGGTIARYLQDFIQENLYERWFQLNVIHNTTNHQIDVYINGQHRLTSQDHGLSPKGFWYFKVGVYMQIHGSPTMQVQVKNITLWKFENERQTLLDEKVHLEKETVLVASQDEGRKVSGKHHQMGQNMSTSLSALTASQHLRQLSLPNRTSA